MTVQEAEQMLIDAYDNYSLPEENKFRLIEALEFLIEETHDPAHMAHLGGIYYSDRRFDLALKYYEMAASYGHTIVYECLGYIWYYGRTGERDYKKAFECYSRAAAAGSKVSVFKLADMYRNGYYVEKDYDRYCSMIEDLYKSIEGTEDVNDPLPEVSLRLASIRREQGRMEEALELLMDARAFQAWIVELAPDFISLRNMEYLTNDLYELIEFDRTDFGLFDLYHALKTPSRITFRHERVKYEIESAEEDGTIVVRFEDKWFRSIRDFFEKAYIGEDLLVTLSYELYDWEVKQ